MSGQKFVARNRAPRVQIEYDVELYGAEKKVQLPFVMGVMADLAGKSEAASVPVSDRGFLDVDVDNFDARMAAIRPRVTFAVPNTLTGEGELAVDLEFARMDDFSPAEIARRVAPLRALLEARSALADLVTYMDGKASAEALVERLLADTALLSAIAKPDAGAGTADAALTALRASFVEAPVQGAGLSAALEGLRAVAIPDTPTDGIGDVLDGMKGAAPAEVAPEDDVSLALHNLRGVEVADAAAEDIGALLDGLKKATPAEVAAEDDVSLALDDLRGAEVTDAAADDIGALLDGLKEASPAEVEAGDDLSLALDDLRGAEVAEAAADDIGALLDGLKEAAPAEVAAEDDLSLALDDLRGAEVAEAAADDLGALLDGLKDAAPAKVAVEDDLALALDDLRSADAAEVGADDIGALLDGLEGAAPAEAAAEKDLSLALDDLRGADVAEAAADDIRGLLAGLEGAAPAEAAADDDLSLALDDLRGADAAEVEADDIGALLDGLEDAAPAEAAAGDDLSLALDDLRLADVAEAEASDMDALLGGLEDLADAGEGPSPSVEDLPASSDAPGGAGPADGLGDDVDLDLLLSGMDGDGTEAPVNGPVDGGAAELDDLLSGLGGDVPGGDVPTETVGDGALSDLDALFTDMDEATSAPVVDGSIAVASASTDAAGASGFGYLGLPSPQASLAARDVFRIAILADCSGRAAAGRIETGDAIAARRAIRLDVDRIESVVEGFATRLTLPLGAEGAAIEVDLPDLDALHPDELFDAVDAFSELRSLRQRLGGSGADQAMREMQGWAATGLAGLSPARSRSGGVAVPADLRMGGLAALAGRAKPVHSRTADDLIARAVAPHIVAAPHPEAKAYAAAVDAALTDLMRAILHHPEFQQIEATWRTLDFLVRRIETGAKVELVLFDISAEEFAADLAAQDDLSQSGLFRLLAEAPLSEGGAGGFSAIMGIYTFCETPPHAELLGRMAKIAAWTDAAFVTGIDPATLDTAPEDRHPLVRAAWDELQAMPQAKWLGLALPRFMLRHPYGRRTDPIDRFAFEEFSPAEGLSGLLWGHPAAVVAVLLAQSWTKGGRSLGKVMSLGEMPFHYMIDRHGDQVALPCTERNLTLTRMELAAARRLMPLVSMRGRDQVRLAWFEAFGGGTLLGPWAEARPDVGADAPMMRAAPALSVTVVSPAPEAALADAPAAEPVAGEDDLDALLASFADPGPSAPADASAIDAELNALLEGL